MKIDITKHERWSTCLEADLSDPLGRPLEYENTHTHTHAHTHTRDDLWTVSKKI